MTSYSRTPILSKKSQFLLQEIEQVREEEGLDVARK